MKQKQDFVQLGVRVTKTMHDQLQDLADKQHRTVSQVVRIALLIAIEQHNNIDAMPSVKEYIKSITV